LDRSKGSDSTYVDGSEKEDMTQLPSEDKDEMEEEILFLQKRTPLTSCRRISPLQTLRRSTTSLSGRNTSMSGVQDYLDSEP
jgi:hypothetical protein